jgi:hypothetical protein
MAAMSAVTREMKSWLAPVLWGQVSAIEPIHAEADAPLYRKR